MVSGRQPRLLKLRDNGIIIINNNANKYKTCLRSPPRGSLNCQEMFGKLFGLCLNHLFEKSSAVISRFMWVLHMLAQSSIFLAGKNA